MLCTSRKLSFLTFPVQCSARKKENSKKKQISPEELENQDKAQKKTNGRGDNEKKGKRMRESERPIISVSFQWKQNGGKIRLIISKRVFYDALIYNIDIGSVHTKCLKMNILIVEPNQVFIHFKCWGFCYVVAQSSPCLHPQLFKYRHLPHLDKIYISLECIAISRAAQLPHLETDDQHHLHSPGRRLPKIGRGLL